MNTQELIAATEALRTGDDWIDGTQTTIERIMQAEAEIARAIALAVAELHELTNSPLRPEERSILFADPEPAETPEKRIDRIAAAKRNIVKMATWTADRWIASGIETAEADHPRNSTIG